jgi:hypothetical protein
MHTRQERRANTVTASEVALPRQASRRGSSSQRVDQINTMTGEGLR